MKRGDRLHTDYNIEQVETEAELLQLETAWKSLLARVPTTPIFLTWEWITRWWRHFSQVGKLWLLTARNGGTGHLKGVAPWMMVRHHFGPLRLRRLAFIGSGLVYPAHLDIIAAPDERDEVAAALVSFLQQKEQDWDLLDLESLAADSLLREHLAELGRARREENSAICPFIPLPESWERYEEIFLSSKFRKNLRYYSRRLERDNPDQIEFQQVTEPEQLSAAIDTLANLHRKRWGAEGRTTAFKSEQFVAFHREIATTALELGWLRFYQLLVDNQVIASKYCFCYQDVFYWYQTAFDPEWGKYSPGRTLLAHVIRQAIQEGASELDMLHGAGGHKSDWTEKARVDSHMLVANNWRGQLWLSIRAFVQQSKEIGKRTVPESVQRRVEHFFFEQRYQEGG